MDRIIDEIVKVRVSDAVAAATSTSVNTAAVVGVTEKQGAATQVLYDQESVEEAYETGTRRVVFLEPSLMTAASGEVQLKLGGATVATAKVKGGEDASTVRSVLKSLATSFNAEGYTAKASSTKLTITSEAYGATASEDGEFTVVWNATGFSGNPSNTDGTDGADIVPVTKAFFEEEDNPGKVVCIPVDADPTAADIGDVLDAALNLGRDANNREIDFYHVIVRLGDDATPSSVVSLAEALEEWCKTNFKLGHIEVQDRTLGEDAMATISEKPLSRVAIYFHKEDGKSLAAAIVSDRCGNDPARGTWAHKSLTSIKADPTSKANFKDAEDLGLNIYAKVSGVDRLFFGTTCSNKAFIDSVVKKDWLKFRTQEAIFDTLGSANNGDGVDYNDSGIQAIAAAMNGIFNTAMDNDHRYVLPDSTDIDVPKYADISAEDKAVRNLPDVKATFSIQESIHTTKTVELQVFR